MEPILDLAVLRELHAAGEGYIYNEPEGRAKKVIGQNLLHHAACPNVRWMRVRLSRRRGPTKYFSRELDQAIGWLIHELGPEGGKWRRCRDCLEEG